jgi:NAD(P)-dependent dehydrogenase (short-subunit alcohol dehydrogenase family)
MQIRTDTAPRSFGGEPVPAPPPERSAGPVSAGRGSQLAGRVAVITGGARGIGRAIAVELAANGADIVAIDIAGPATRANSADPATPADLEETLRQVRSFGRRAEAFQADVRDIDTLRRIADQVEAAHGRIDIVVADAAVQYWKPLLELEDDEWRDVIDINLNGAANTIRAFAPKMVARRRGRILLVSSMQGKHGTKHAASYSASKWGVLGLMKSAALELGEHNITVNAIVPGLVDTALTRNAARLAEAIGEATGKPPPKPATAQAAWDARSGSLPLKVGWLQPDDVSPVAVFLASDAAAMVTGAEYEVTAGDSAKSM